MENLTDKEKFGISNMIDENLDNMCKAVANIPAAKILIFTVKFIKNMYLVSNM